MNTDDLNYYNDSRTAPAKPVTCWVEGEDGRDIEVELPTKWGVCSVCDGEGKHVNPSIDAGGISAEAFYDDPDFAEDYFGGTYDVTCYRCHGRTTERVVDWDVMSDELREAYEAELDAEAYARAEHLAELRMGC